MRPFNDLKIAVAGTGDVVPEIIYMRDLFRRG